MNQARLKFGIPDLELAAVSGVKINPSSFAGHELVVVFCPSDPVAALREVALYQDHCAELVARDAWILAFSDGAAETRVDGPGRVLMIPDTDRHAWTAFRGLADCPTALDRGSGATFLFTRGGSLRRYWHGPGHVHKVLAELADTVAEQAH